MANAWTAFMRELATRSGNDPWVVDGALPTDDAWCSGRLRSRDRQLLFFTKQSAARRLAFLSDEVLEADYWARYALPTRAYLRSPENPPGLPVGALRRGSGPVRPRYLPAPCNVGVRISSVNADGRFPWCSPGSLRIGWPSLIAGLTSCDCRRHPDEQAGAEAVRRPERELARPSSGRRRARDEFPEKREEGGGRGRRACGAGKRGVQESSGRSPARWRSFTPVACARDSARERRRGLYSIEIAGTRQHRAGSSGENAVAPLRAATQPVRRALLPLQRQSPAWSVVVLQGSREQSIYVEIRGLAAEALGSALDGTDGRTKLARHAVALLVESLTDESPEVRYNAAFALSVSRIRIALPVLRRVARTDRSVSQWGPVADAAREAIRSITHRNK